MACLQTIKNEQATHPAAIADAVKNAKTLLEKQTEVLVKPSEIIRGRRKLPDERKAIIHKFTIAGHEGYITVGMYEDGTPGEVFITMSKEGTVVSGLVDSFATAISMALQYGVPLEALVSKFTHMRYEPSGVTKNPQIRFAKSITDYIFRWLDIRFLKHVDQKIDVASNEKKVIKADVKKGIVEQDENEVVSYVAQLDAPPCKECGTIMIRSGSCYKCPNCSFSSGCS